MEYHVLASGSKGNSTFIYDQGIGILIDCGISKKQLEYRLNSLGYSLNHIDLVLLTHDHSDHNKNIHIFNKNKVYAGKDAMEDLDELHTMIPYQNFSFKHLTILPLSTSHDANGTLAYLFKNGSESLLYMTDTGYVSQKNQGYIQNLDYYIIESNHDVTMLMNCARPMYLKRRILSDVGHLSNEYSAYLMCHMIGKATKEIILAHLSEEANTPELALNTYFKIFNENQIDLTHIKIKTASQRSVVSGGNHENKDR